MRRLLLPTLALLACALPASALAGTGLTPPSTGSESAEGIRDIYLILLAISGGIFLVVAGTLTVFLIRYRSRGRDRSIEGPQVHGSKKLELIWTAVPIIILIGIAAAVLAFLSQINDAGSAPRQTIRVEAYQFYWLYRYPGGGISIDRLVLPVDEAVELELTANDVVHSWWVPSLSGKLDAIPGRTNHLRFTPNKIGVYPGRCAELCGLLHSNMPTVVDVVSKADYERWIARRNTRGALALGREEFGRVCARCHGNLAQGGLGGAAPGIAGNPLLTNKAQLEDLLRNGRRVMPPVGRGWSDAQMNALIAYFKHHTFPKPKESE